MQKKTKEGRNNKTTRKKTRDGQKDQGLRKDLSRSLCDLKRENITPHEESTKTTKKNKNHLPLPKTLYTSFTPIPTPKIYPTSTIAETQMKMPANRECSTTPHAAMHWSACYEDKSDVHLRDKEGAGWWPKQPRRHQPRQAAKKVCWSKLVTPEDQHNKAGKLVDNLQDEMLRMAEEIGRLKEEKRGLKKRVVLAGDLARKAGIEARRRVYENVEP